MDVETASQQLVHEVLAVVVSQVLTTVDHSVHVCLHQVRNDVDVFEPTGSWWLLDVHEADDVLMVEELYTQLISDKRLNLLSSLISLTILFASMRSSKALGTFLMATLALML